MSHWAPESSPLPQRGAGRGGGPQAEREPDWGREGAAELEPAPCLLWPLALSLFLEMHFTFISPFSHPSPRFGVIGLPFSPLSLLQSTPHPKCLCYL